MSLSKLYRIAFKLNAEVEQLRAELGKVKAELDELLNEINNHLKISVKHLGYETDSENILSMVILLRESITKESLTKELAKTGLAHWSEHKEDK